nr:transcriptional regulator [Pseudomonas sp.]
EMLLHLAEQLDIPLRERNSLLTAGGYAPVFSERPMADPAMAAARRAVELVLAGHEPYPALALDRHWHMLSANRAVAPLLQGVAPVLLEPPVNVLRLSLHPDGLASRIVNLHEWRAHLLSRLHNQIEVNGDPVLASLFDELRGLPTPAADAAPHRAEDLGGVAVPFRLQTKAGVLSFLSTTTVFGTPVDITLSELAVESFFPADAATADAMLAMLGR